MIFFFSRLVLSLVCDGESIDNSKKTFGKNVPSDNATSNNASLHFLIPDEAHKNLSFKRSEIELGNPFANKKCQGACNKYFHLGNPPTLIVENGFWKYYVNTFVKYTKSKKDLLQFLTHFIVYPYTRRTN